MPRFRVLVAGRALVSYLELPFWETPDRSWVESAVEDEDRLVTVLGAETGGTVRAC